MLVALAVRVRSPVIFWCVYGLSDETKVLPLYHPVKVYPEFTVALKVALPPSSTLTLVAVPEKLSPAATYAVPIPALVAAVTL